MNNISIEEKEKKHYYRNIWMLKLRLLSSYLKDEKIIREIANSNEFIMRDNAIEYLNYLSKKI